MNKPIPFDGFNRVIIDYEGTGVPYTRAAKDYHIEPTIGFMRNDGWSLGAPAELESVAYRMWADEWKWFIRTGEIEWRPIKEYQGHY